MMGSKMDGSQERKAPERIDLGGYIRSGEGFTAESYDSLDGRSMLKLYKAFVPEEVAWRELRVGLALEKSGIRTPRVRRIVSRPLIRLSQIPMMKAPMTAPGMEPMPPNTAATKAFRPGMPPEVGTTPG